jgi:hypothetical protein
MNRSRRRALKLACMTNASAARVKARGTPVERTRGAAERSQSKKLGVWAKELARALRGAKPSPFIFHDTQYWVTNFTSN